MTREEPLAERIARLERVGRWTEADALCAGFLEDALRRRSVKDLLWALWRRSHIALQLGDSELATDFAVLGGEIASLHGHDAYRARSLNLQAAACYHEHRWEDASDLYGEALQTSLQSGNHELVASVCQNLGVIANIRGDIRGAKLCYLEALGAAVRAGATGVQAMAYNNLGMACADQHEWIEADLHFARAGRLAARAGDGSLLVKVRVNRAEPLIHLGDLRSARYTLELASEVAQAGTSEIRVDALRYRGMLARAEGDPDRSLSALEEALALAREKDLPLEQAEVLRELALTERAVERLQAAREHMREARDLFAGLGARRDRDAAETWLEGRREASAGSPAAASYTAPA